MSGKLRAHIRQNVVGYVALFLVVSGGTAYAVDGPLAGTNQVGSADIIDQEVKTEDIRDANVGLIDLKADSVNSAKILTGAVQSADVQDDAGTGGLQGVDIAANTLTGADVDEATLAGVDADEVDGLNAALIDHQTTDITVTPVEVLNLGGLVLRLECVNTDLFEPRLIAATTVDDAIVRSRAMPDFGIDEVVVITDDDFDTGAGDEKTLYDATQGSGLINYRTPAGSNVTVQYMVDGIGSVSGGCSVSGTAFQGTP